MSARYMRTIKNLQTNFINIGKDAKPNPNPSLINVLFCDYGDKYMPKIFNSQDIINTAEDIAEASNILGLNQIVTEHNPKVFGYTINEVKKHLRDPNDITQKTRFSMLDDEMIKNDGGKAVYVLLGMETHICITQTALKILEHDRDLILLTDGISSANEGDRNIALGNLRNLGAYLTTSQSFLFLLLQDSSHPKFKELLPILKRFSSRENSLLNSAKF